MNISETWQGFVDFGQNLVSTITLKISGVALEDSTAGIIFFALLALVVVGFLANTKRKTTQI